MLLIKRYLHLKWEAFIGSAWLKVCVQSLCPFCQSLSLSLPPYLLLFDYLPLAPSLYEVSFLNFWLFIGSPSQIYQL